jgi:hypothetical protein
LTVGVNWRPVGDKHDVYVVLDPEEVIDTEISTLNNVANAAISRDSEPRSEGEI